MSKAQNILDILIKQTKVKQLVEKARSQADPACAATMSLILREAGILKANEFYPWTAQLAGSDDDISILEQRFNMKRIHHPADILPGDLIASRDRNLNKAPDHVFIAVGKPEGDTNNPCVLVIDNYCRNGLPYWRNLGRSGWYAGRWRGKTPMAYALRFMDGEEHDDEIASARQALVNSLAPVYKAAEISGLSQPTMHHLNQLRFSAELRKYKPE